MSQPTPYTPSTDFTDLPDEQVKTKLDIEFADIATTFEETLANLAQIQRDDGALANGIVTPDSLSQATLALIGGFEVRGAWITARAYAIGDVVTQGTGTYLCFIAHTSGVFATDLAAGKWILFAGTAGAGIALDDLTDVVITTPVSGHIAKYNGTNWVNGLIAASNIGTGVITVSHIAGASLTDSLENAEAAATDATIPTTTAMTNYAKHTYRKGSVVVTGSSGVVTLANDVDDVGGPFNYVSLGLDVSTNVTQFTLDAGEFVWCRCTSVITLVHNATLLILPGAANIVTAANDRFLLYSLDGTNCIVLNYTRAAGTNIVSDIVLGTTGTLTVARGGTGAATFTQNAVLLGNGTGAFQVVAPGAAGQALISDGTTWASAAIGAPDYQPFTSSGTWTKPSGFNAGARVLIEAWGAGGSGGRNSSTQPGGGGGGSYKARWVLLSDMGATETITVGAGGAAKGSNANGDSGGSSSCGTLVVAYGGSGGDSVTSGSIGGSGGGFNATAAIAVGNDTAAIYGEGFGAIGPTNTVDAARGGYNTGGGGGFGGASVANGSGASSVYGGGGGGGGGSGTHNGGASSFGGAGGAGTTSGTAVSGGVRGGGGGGATSGTSGAGGRGEARVTVYR